MPSLAINNGGVKLVADKRQIRELIGDIGEGEYVIPYFQRGCEWDASMVSDLFVSILQDYYTGTILLWDLRSRDVKIKMNWDPLWGVREAKEQPSYAVLDGQQRLFSVYYAIYAPPEKFPNRKSYYYFFINLDRFFNEDYEESVVYIYRSRPLENTLFKADRDELIDEGLFPLSLLSDSEYMRSEDFEQWLNEYVKRKREEGVIDGSVTPLGISRLLEGILDYGFSAEVLKGRGIPEICDIFARINEKGMKLDTFDLMNAFLYPHGISLRKDWEELELEDLKNADSNMRTYLLKLASLYKQKYCSSKYIYYLVPKVKKKTKMPSGVLEETVLIKSKEEFEKLWRDSCLYAEKARKQLMNVGEKDFGAIKSKFIPNTTIIPVLGALLLEVDRNESRYDVPEVAFHRKASRWYWSAVLSEDYSGSSDTVMANDLEDLKEWLTDDSQVPERVKKINRDYIINKLNLPNKSRGSRYNAILCMLALKGAKDFFTGRPLGTYAEINDHHIFPAHVEGLEIDPDRKHCILNRTLILNETNNEIKNDKPAQYLRKMLSKWGGESNKLREIMDSHFISEDALECLWSNDFDSFIDQREETITSHICTLLRLYN